MADETKPAAKSADPKVSAPNVEDSSKSSAEINKGDTYENSDGPSDVAANDFRARGDELTMSDRYAPSHLAAQNQVPQEGKPVQNPPQPEPPKDSNIENQDRTGPDGMSVFPKNRRVGQGIPADEAGLA